MQRKVFIPEGLTVNHPFFYIIQHTPSGRYYAGYCCKKSHCDSNKFMSKDGYQTSSKIIKQFIKNEGLSVFQILKIKHFELKTDAIGYEVRFLKKVKARRNKMFLNQTEGDKNLITKVVTEDARKKMSVAKTGKKRGPMSEEHKRKIGQSNKGRKASKETKLKLKISHMGKIQSEETRNKRSVSHKNGNYRCSEEHKEKMRISRKGIPLSEETKRKMNLTRKGRITSEETKEKMRKIMSGRTFSEESIQRMREAAKNRVKKSHPLE